MILESYGHVKVRILQRMVKRTRQIEGKKKEGRKEERRKEEREREKKE